MARSSTSGRDFDIQDAADGILQKKDFAKSVPPPAIKRFHFYAKAIRDQVHSARTSSLLRYYWQSTLIEPHELRRIEFIDTTGELSRDMANLRNEVETEIADLRERVESVEHELASIRKSRVAIIDELCRAYVQIVNSINEVVKVLLVEDEDVAEIWTIIDAPPFEDQLRIPVYDAQLETLRSSQVEIPVEFHVLNLLEISDKRALERIIPPHARLIWQR